MCPYYLARELKKEADIIFMPYNYILDVKVPFDMCSSIDVYKQCSFVTYVYSAFRHVGFMV